MDATALATPLLEVRACRQSYHKESSADFVVLDDVNLSIADGEIVGLLGRSGSGKSTLLRIVSGLLAPTQGEVIWRGARLVGPAPGIAMVFQSFALFPWLTVQENVELGLEAQGVARAQPGGGGNRPDRPRRLRERLSERAVRGHAAARRPRPRARRTSRPSAHG
jgi:NitT/TauT family transport system ATP-binding protein